MTETKKYSAYWRAYTENFRLMEKLREFYFGRFVFILNRPFAFILTCRLKGLNWLQLAVSRVYHRNGFVYILILLFQKCIFKITSILFLKNAEWSAINPENGKKKDGKSWVMFINVNSFLIDYSALTRKEIALLRKGIRSENYWEQKLGLHSASFCTP